MVSVLTCSFLQPDLCAQFSPLLGIPCPWKFASTCQASVLAHVRPVGQHVSHTNYHCEMRLSRLKLIWCVALQTGMQCCYQLCSFLNDIITLQNLGMKNCLTAVGTQALPCIIYDAFVCQLAIPELKTETQQCDIVNGVSPQLGACGGMETSPCQTVALTQ